MGIKCFMLTPVAKIRVWARRYSNNALDCCPRHLGQYSYHNNMNLIGDFDYPLPQNKYEEWTDFVEALRPPAGDPRWPAACLCGQAFEDNQTSRGGQMFTHRIFVRSDNGELTTLQEAPAGALWYATWMKHDEDDLYGWDWNNQIGSSLICKLPNDYEWNIDSRASNCTMKEERTHRCWCRHGEPPNIHVDKQGHTCAAGAGSILSGCWHGFLHNGELVL